MTEKKISTYTEDLSFDRTALDAPAMFLPSMSRNYVAYASAYEKKMSDERHPKGLHRDGRELNIFQKDNGCYYYPYALTSAGHANLDIDHTALNDREGIFRSRIRKDSIVMGDSGGYQIGKGLLKFDWKNFESEENNILRMKILKWLESIADISMTLDVPVWGIDEGLEGVTTFDDCLAKTKINHEFFHKHRTPGATRFLNILHGRNKDEGDKWYKAMKDEKFEGWAFAGVNMSNFELIMRRLIIMRDEGYLDKERNWIHFLGVSRLTSSCAFSAIQRNIRKYVEPTLTISYDASSPFLSTAHGRWYTKLTYSKNNMNYTMDQIIDNKDLAGSKLPFPLMTPIGKKLTMGDLSVKGHNVDSKSSWDSWSYMYMMNHNMYMHIRGINEVNTLYQMPRPHVADYVTKDILEFRDLCEEIFTSSNPMDLIEKHSAMLMNLSGARNDNAGSNAFDGLFQLEGTGSYDDEHVFDDTGLGED